MVFDILAGIAGLRSGWPTTAAQAVLIGIDTVSLPQKPQRFAARAAGALERPVSPGVGRKLLIIAIAHGDQMMQPGHEADFRMGPLRRSAPTAPPHAPASGAPVRGQ